MCLRGEWARGERGRHILGAWVCGKFGLGVGFTFLVAHSQPSPFLGILGTPTRAWGRRSRAWWLRGLRVRGAGRRTPTVRLADRCHFLLGFRASRRGAPCLCPIPALRGQSCQSPSLLPKSGRAEEVTPHIQLSRERGRSAPSPRIRPWRTQAGWRVSGRLPGERRQP